MQAITFTAPAHSRQVPDIDIEHAIETLLRNLDPELDPLPTRFGASGAVDDA